MKKYAFFISCLFLISVTLKGSLMPSLFIVNPTAHPTLTLANNYLRNFDNYSQSILHIFDNTINSIITPEEIDHPFRHNTVLTKENVLDLYTTKCKREKRIVLRGLNFYQQTLEQKFIAITSQTMQAADYVILFNTLRIRLTLIKTHHARSFNLLIKNNTSHLMSLYNRLASTAKRKRSLMPTAQEIHLAHQF